MATWTYKGNTYTSDGKGAKTVTSNSGKSSSAPQNTGYGSGMGYGNRETAYTWKDGSTTYSNATRYEDAAREAGKVGVGLSSSVSYGSSGQQKQNGNSGIYSNGTATGKNYENAIKYEQQVANNYGLGTDPSAGKYGVGYGYTDTYYNPYTDSTPMLPGIAENMGKSSTVDYGNIKDFAVNSNAYADSPYAQSTPYLSNNPYNPYASLVENNQKYYEGNEDRIADLYAAMLKQGVDSLESNRKGIKDGYEDSARQAYVAMLRGNRDLAGQLAADGLNGGATESARLAIQNQYQNNLNSVNTGLNKEMANLDNSITDLRNSTNLQQQQQILSNSQAALEAYNSLMQNSINYNYQAGRDYVGDQRYNQEYADNRAWQEKQYNNTLEQQKYNQALNMLQLGYSTADTAGALGLSESQLNSYIGYVNQLRQDELTGNSLALQSQRQALNKASGSGSGSGSGTTKTLTYSQAASTLDSGNITPAALKVYEQYQGVPYTNSPLLDMYASRFETEAGFNNAVAQAIKKGDLTTDVYNKWLKIQQNRG